MAEHSEGIGQPNPFDEHTRMWADEFDDRWSATPCRWCGCRLDTCRPLRADQRKCCPDCEHVAEHSEDFDQARKQALIDQARKQVDGLSRWSGGSLRLEAYRVIDTMNELVLLAEREHSASSGGAQ